MGWTSRTLLAAAACAVLPSAARASPVSLGLGVGAVVNDPFLRSVAAMPQVSFQLSPALNVDLRGGWVPDFGTGDWKAATTQLVEENSVSPDISKISGFSTVSVRATPIGTVWKGGSSTVGFSAGAGLVWTSDDLEALQAVDDPRAETTESQRHGCGAFGVVGQNWWGRSGLQVDFQSIVYIETVNATTLEMKNNLMLGASYVVQL